MSCDGPGKVLAAPMSCSEIALDARKGCGHAGGSFRP